MHVSDERFQDRYARCDVPNVDLKHPAEGVWDANPGEVVGSNFWGGRCTGDRDETCYDPKAHQAAESYLGLPADVEVAEKDDGKGGADEVCQEGDGYAGYLVSHSWSMRRRIDA